MEWRDVLGRVTAWRAGPPFIAVVRLAGIIGQGAPGRRGLNLWALDEALERAFKTRNLKAVALAINSPGGAAVQSSLIHKRIRALAAEKGVPVIAFAEDLAASGGYWLALAADEIFADESSIVGSIGVIYSGFGLVDLIAKLGVERRVHTAGEKKTILDPFRPEKAEDVARLCALQGEVHAQFRNAVRARRGRKLRAPDEVLFSGEFWTGARALELGLIDGLGELKSTMRERFGAAVRFRTVRAERSFLRGLLRQDAGAFGGAPDARWIDGALDALEDRLAWARFGL